MTSSKNLFIRSILAGLGMLALPFSAAADDDGPGAVYTMTNAADTNRIVVFSRGSKGELQSDHSLPTGGKGTGGGLGSQGALALGHDGKWLLAVNAGSNEVSVFS